VSSVICRLPTPENSIVKRSHASWVPNITARPNSLCNRLKFETIPPAEFPVLLFSSSVTEYFKLHIFTRLPQCIKTQRPGGRAAFWRVGLRLPSLRRNGRPDLFQSSTVVCGPALVVLHEEALQAIGPCVQRLKLVAEIPGGAVALAPLLFAGRASKAMIVDRHHSGLGFVDTDGFYPARLGTLIDTPLRRFLTWNISIPAMCALHYRALFVDGLNDGAPVSVFAIHMGTILRPLGPICGFVLA